MLRFVALLAFAVATSSTSALASGGTEGHGGIDILLPNGSSMPIEAYVEIYSDPVVSVCDLVESVPGYGDADEWRQHVNKTVQRLHRKVPAAADMLLRALKKPYYRFLNLSGDAKLVYTRDDGSFVEGPKFNGALRVGDNVYISKEVWQNYWTHRIPGFEYATMLTRILHEALISNYSNHDKLLLGEAVIEILRYAGFYRAKNGPKEFSKLKPEEVRQFLLEHSLFDLEHEQKYATGMAGTFSNDFQIYFAARSEKIDEATHQNGTYESEKFWHMKRFADEYLAKESKEFQFGWNGMFGLTSFADLSRLNRFLKKVDNAFYTITNVDGDGYRGGTIVTKYGLSPQLKLWSDYLKSAGPRVCESY